MKKKLSFVLIFLFFSSLIYSKNIYKKEGSITCDYSNGVYNPNYKLEINSDNEDSAIFRDYLFGDGVCIVKNGKNISIDYIDVVRKNFYSPVEYVLQYDIHKKHINDESCYYGPPLFWSLMKGNKEISELLLRNGANPNFITANGLSAYESIDEFVANQLISQMKAYELKQMLVDFGYGNENLDKYYINENQILRDSFELRTVELLSSPIITTLQKGSSVKIKMLGKYETIDGIKNRWVYIETQENAKDRDGKGLKTGTCGWCFGGYLE